MDGAVEFWSWKRMAVLVAVGVVVSIGFAGSADADVRPAEPVSPTVSVDTLPRV